MIICSGLLADGKSMPGMDEYAGLEADALEMQPLPATHGGQGPQPPVTSSPPALATPVSQATAPNPGECAVRRPSATATATPTAQVNTLVLTAPPLESAGGKGGAGGNDEAPLLDATAFGI